MSSVARQLLLAIALFASSGAAWVQPACTADRYGKAACTEGCEAGSVALCARPR